MRTNRPFLNLTTWKGPLPTIGGLLMYELCATPGLTFSQTCLGRIGMPVPAASMSALGFEQTILTVSGSTASTRSMPAVSIVKFHSSPWMM